MKEKSIELKDQNGKEQNDAIENQTEEVDYEQLLSSAGEFGLYQLVLFLMTSPFYVFGGFVYFSQVFLTEVSPNHWCWIPELENLTVLERRSIAIPADAETPLGYSHCSSYVANWTEVLISGSKPDSSWGTQKCLNGWEFDKTEIPYPTISSELGWVCEKDSYQATAQSLFFVGCIIGGFIVGWVSDRFGRLPAAVFANIIGCVFGIASTFTRNFLEFTICRILMGMAYDNCMMMTYLLVLEYTAPKYRTLMTNLSFAIFFTLGLIALPWIALACGDWKLISLVTSIPLALSLLAPFVLPESPRWLLSKNKVDDVVTNILAVAKRNNKVVPPELISKFRSTIANKKEETSTGIIELFKRPLLRNMFICVCLEYLCCVLIFDSLVRTIGSLKFDFFISFTLISFTEFPSLFLLSFIMDLTGRKSLVLVASLICALFSFLTPFVGGGISSVMCAMVARFCVNMSFNAVLQWTAELMPTPVRGSASSIVHICGYLATVISPFIAYLDVFVSGISLVVIGCIAVIASILPLYLPETAKKEMPQTFDDAEYMMKTKKLWQMPKKASKEVSNYNNTTNSDRY